MSERPRSRGRRWLYAGGIVGLAASPRLARAARDVLGRVVRDPEAPFRKAPCMDKPER